MPSLKICGDICAQDSDRPTTILINMGLLDSLALALVVPGKNGTCAMWILSNIAASSEKNRLIESKVVDLAKAIGLQRKDDTNYCKELQITIHNVSCQ